MRLCLWLLVTLAGSCVYRDATYQSWAPSQPRAQALTPSELRPTGMGRDILIIMTRSLKHTCYFSVNWMHAYHAPKAGLEGLSEICTAWWLSLLMNPPGLPQRKSPSLRDFSGTCTWGKKKKTQISKTCNWQEQLFLLSSTDLNQEEPAYTGEGSSGSSETSRPFCACDQPHGSCPPEAGTLSAGPAPCRLEVRASLKLIPFQH